MKMKRLTLVMAAVACVLLFCAFKAIPTVRLSYGGEYDVDVSYHNAQVDADKLAITVNYNSRGEFFEIGRDIIVAADSSFNNPLRMKSSNVKDGCYVYEFDATDLGEAKTVYIKPPILYMPTGITSVSVPLAAGKVAKMSAEDVKFETASSNWFSIDSVGVEDNTEGCYTVRVSILANGKDLPRFPKLVNGTTQIGGISALRFNETDDFESGEFLFTVNAGSQKEALKMVAESSLVVSDALIRVDTDELAFSSNVKSISVVVSESE